MTTGLPVDLDLQIAFGYSPNDKYASYTSIPEVQSIQIGPWGRTYELDSTSPTQASFLVDSTSGSYANVQRWNLSDNPSFGVDTHNWTGTSCTIARVTTNAFVGSTSLQVTTASNTSATFGAAVVKHTPSWGPGAPATIGVKVALSCYVKATANSRSAILYAVWADGTKTALNNATSLTNGSYTRLSGTCVVPSTSANYSSVGMEIRVSTPAAGEIFYVDAILIEQASTIKPYFDGSNLDSSLAGRSWWNGTSDYSTSTFDSQITVGSPMVLAITSEAGNASTLFHGQLSAVPTRLDSGSFDYATTTFKATDVWDAFGCITLRSALVEQTLAQKPTAYYILNDQPGATAAGDSVTGLASAPVVSGINQDYFTQARIGEAGILAFGATSLCEPQQTDPTTSASFFPHFGPNGIGGTMEDGGSFIVIGTNGVGSYLTGSEWSFRATFASEYPHSGGTIFCQAGTNTESPAAYLGYGIRVLLGGDGRVNLFYPTNAGSDTYQLLQSPDSGLKYNDGAPHTVEIRMLYGGAKIIVDGVQVASNSVPCRSMTKVGPVVIGCSVNGNLTYPGQWMMGRIGHVALFDSTFNAAWAIDDGHNARLSYPADTPSTRIARIVQKWAKWNGSLIASSSSTPLGAQSCAGSTVAQELLKIESATQGMIFTQPSISNTLGAIRFVDPATINAQQSLYLLGTDAYPIDMTGLVFEKDRQHLVNEITATRPGGPTITLTDDTSIAQHGRRTSGSTIVFYVNTDANLKTAAQAYLDKYSKPRLRVGSVSINLFALSDTINSYSLATWAHPSYRVTITNLPSTAPAQTMDFIIESVSHQITPTSWVMTLALAPFFY
jgi:hypothetical protein